MGHYNLTIYARRAVSTFLFECFVQGYAPSIFYPKRTAKVIFENLVTQCEKMGIEFLPQLPSPEEIDKEYNVVMDAIFGFSFKGAVRAPFDEVLSALRKVKTPICSVDVPSGECMRVCVWNECSGACVSDCVCSSAHLCVRHVCEACVCACTPRC